MSTAETMDLERAVELAGGLTAVARKRGISPAAVSKWVKNGRLPHTDYSGHTDHASAIVELIRERHPHLAITREQLLRPGAAEEGEPSMADLAAEVARIVALASRGEREFQLLRLTPALRADVESELVLQLASRVREELEPLAAVPTWLADRVLEMADVRPERRAASV